MISFLQCIIFEPISYSEFILVTEWNSVDSSKINQHYSKVGIQEMVQIGM